MKLYEKELGEFVENISDTEKINKDEVILVNTSDVENGKVINHNYVKNSNLKGQFKKRFKRNDILYSEIRPKNKRFAYIDFDSEDYIASTKLMVLRNKGNIDNEYLYQILKSDYVINYLQHIAEARSGTFPQITFNELARTKIMIPDQENQKKIAYILNSIDKKIKLNTHTNNNLYEIGLSLIEEEYNSINKTEKLQNIIKFTKGKKPVKIVKYKDKNYDKYLTIACLNYQELNYANKEKMILAQNDILMVMDGASSGEVYYSDCGIVGSTFARIDIINKTFTKEYMFFILKKYTDLIKTKNTGSAIPHADKAFINLLSVPILSIENQKKYCTILKKIQQNEHKIRNLMIIRDILLPKLMNGEIDLDKIEI